MMELNVRGFSPRRVAVITAILSLTLVPVHFYVSCQMSEKVAIAGMVLFLLAGGLAVADRGGKGAAFPLVLAIVGFLAHGLCTH
jgi:hypothetical protein